MINVREINTNVRELENFSGNVCEIGVTYVRLVQTATTSIKYTPTAILPTPTVILIQRAINTSREDQKMGWKTSEFIEPNFLSIPTKKNINSS